MVMASPVPSPPRLRCRDAPPAGQVVAGERCRLPRDVGERSLGNDLTAVLSGSRADVDDVVGDPDGLLVVLDHDEGVAEIPQPHQRLDEPPVVSLVEPDRRLVEDVEHAHQTRPDLRGQPDALRFPAGQRGRRAHQREVLETDVDEELKPGADLLDDEIGDLRVPIAQFEPFEELDGRDAATCSRPRRCSCPPTVTARETGLSLPATTHVAVDLAHVLGVAVPAPPRCPHPCSGDASHGTAPSYAGLVAAFAPETVLVGHGVLAGRRRRRGRASCASPAGPGRARARRCPPPRRPHRAAACSSACDGAHPTARRRPRRASCPAAGPPAWHPPGSGCRGRCIPGQAP